MTKCNVTRLEKSNRENEMYIGDMFYYHPLLPPKRLTLVEQHIADHTCSKLIAVERRVDDSMAPNESSGQITENGRYKPNKRVRPITETSVSDAGVKVAKNKAANGNLRSRDETPSSMTQAPVDSVNDNKAVELEFTEAVSMEYVYIECCQTLAVKLDGDQEWQNSPFAERELVDDTARNGVTK